MPQMMPLLWLITFIHTIALMILSLILTHYNYPSFLPPLHNNNKLKYWSWKW